MELYHVENKTITDESAFRASLPNTTFPEFLTQEILTEFGYKVVLHAPQPTATQLQSVVRDGVEIDAKGNAVQKWKLIDKFKTQEEAAEVIAQALSSAKTSKKSIIDGKRKERETAGMYFKFADGIAGTIQTRDSDDIRNIQAITTTGLVLKSSGEVRPVIPFRDVKDVIHMMTPDESIKLGMSVQQFISESYSWSWNLKSQIDAATSVEEVNAIEIV